MAEPIIRTDRESGERTEVTVKEFTDAVKGLMNSSQAIREVCERRRPVQTSFAIYTLNAAWLVEGHDTSEVVSDLAM